MLGVGEMCSITERQYELGKIDEGLDVVCKSCCLDLDEEYLADSQDSLRLIVLQVNLLVYVKGRSQGPRKAVCQDIPPFPVLSTTLYL